MSEAISKNLTKANEDSSSIVMNPHSNMEGTSTNATIYNSVIGTSSKPVISAFDTSSNNIRPYSNVAVAKPMQNSSSSHNFPQRCDATKLDKESILPSATETIERASCSIRLDVKWQQNESLSSTCSVKNDLNPTNASVPPPSISKKGIATLTIQDKADPIQQKQYPFHIGDKDNSKDAVDTTESIHLSQKKNSATFTKPNNTIPVFDHVLLLPLSHHRSNKEPAIPSNYLTPQEEEEEEANQRKLSRKKKRKNRTVSHIPSYGDSQQEDEYEVGRNGRIRKKPKSYADYIELDSEYSESDSDSEDSDSEENDDGESDIDDDNIDDWEESFTDMDEDFLQHKVGRDEVKVNRKRNYKKYKRVDVWDERIQSLQRFMEQHGHTRVTQRHEDDQKLAKWVKKTREKYKKLQKGISVPSLCEKRIAQLDRLGFQWSLRNANLNFDNHFSNLIEFQRENGHTRVPHVYEKDLKLGIWVHHIKLSYKKMKQRKKPNIRLSEEQIAKLDSIGFQWMIRYVVASNAEDKHADFYERLQELKLFQKIHGHCDVPYDGDYNDLACWVTTIRTSRRLMDDAQRPITRLTREEISALDSIHFNWSETPMEWTKSHEMMSWNERYKQLCDFKNRYGHCRVPSEFSDDISFGHWVTQQKARLGAKYTGKYSSLTKEQKQKLEDLGLEWTITKFVRNSNARVSKASSTPKNIVFDLNQWCSSLNLGFEFYTKTESKKAKDDSNFYRHLQDLKRFKELYGHLNVPANVNKSLKCWIYNLRHSYKCKWEGKGQCIQLTNERLSALKEIDFEWETQKDVSWSIKSFERRIDELKRFKETHGHFNVSMASHKSLKLWIYNVRRAYKFKNEGKSQPIQLTDERISALKEIGFEWEASPDAKSCKKSSPLGIKKKTTFNERLEELKSFKKEHGHCNVSTRHNQRLGSWCAQVRYAYNSSSTSKLALSQEQIRDLEEVGFDWASQRKRVHSKARSDPMQSQKRPRVEPKLEDSTMEKWCNDLNLGFQWELNTPSKTSRTRDVKHQQIKKNGDAYIRARRSFEDNVDELKLFMNEDHQKSASLKMSKSLVCWISNVRQSYKRIKNGKSPLIKLPPNRISTLNAIGFDWGEDRYLITPETKNIAAERRPTQPKIELYRDFSMVKWCTDLKLGFEWGEKSEKKVKIVQPKKKKAHKRNRVNFFDNINELKRMKNENGHLNMKEVNKNKSLRSWISNVRHSCIRLKEGKAPLINLSPDRITALEELGLDLNRRRNISPKPESDKSTRSGVEADIQKHTKNAKPTTTIVEKNITKNKKQGQGQRINYYQKGFFSNVEKLKRYKETHGHINVSQKLDKSLNNWISNIKQSYKREKEGKSSLIKLCPERMSALRAFGFDFEEIVTSSPIKIVNEIKTINVEHIDEIRDCEKTSLVGTSAWI